MYFRGDIRTLSTVAHQSAGSFILVGLFALLLMNVSASAQEQMRPALDLIDDSYITEIGKTAISPRTAPSQAGGEISVCQATCDAFEPRQPVLTVQWENVAAGTGPTPSAADNDIRLDISGTPGGFSEGNFSTVRLSNIPQLEAIVLDPASSQAIAGGEILLNRVEANSIVDRASNLPVFVSPAIMAARLPELSGEERAAVEADQQTGALGQVRVLGRASTALGGVSQQVVTMVGLQPGVTYRLRLIQEQDATAVEKFQQICRIPVCPADFVDR